MDLSNLKSLIPEHAKDLRLNVGNVLSREGAPGLTEPQILATALAYRFTHLVENDEYRKLPARLRMNVIGNPGVPKVDFELYSLAVSAINGCGACVVAHEKVVRGAGISAEGVQSAVRIAAVIHGIAAALDSRAAVDEARAVA
jgi:alkyl hydroperoxide reductase subunit D